MSRREIRANQLKDADITFVSLVKRGANRIPFRVQKGDEGMSFDLSTLFRQKSDVEPRVVGFVVRKGADLESNVKRLKAAGFEVGKPKDLDNGSLFAMSDDKATSAYRVDEDLVALVTGPLRGAFDQIAMKSDLSELLNSQTDGIAGISEALSALSTALVPALQDGTDAVSEVLGDFTKYVLTAAGAVPAQVFGINPPDAVTKMDKSKNRKGNPKDAAKPPVAEEFEIAPEQHAKEEAEKAASAKKAEAEAKAAAAKKAEGEKKAKAKAAAGDMNDEEDQNEPNDTGEEFSETGTQGKGKGKKAEDEIVEIVQKSVSGLAGKVQTLVDLVEKMTARIDTVEKSAAKAEQTLRRVVPGTDAGGDATARTKSEGKVIPLLDTALERKAS